MSELIRAAQIGGSDLTRQYLQEASGVARFFAGSPYRIDSYREKLEEVRGRFDRDRREAAAACLVPTSDVARERLERFVEEGGAMVTTGQQAGFLTGPLYTIYKAVSAVVLARHLEKHFGTIVIPVFWIASEDHDWEEINHTALLDPRNGLHEVSLSTTEKRPIAMSDRTLDADVGKVLDRAIQIVGSNQSTDSWVKGITDPYRATDATMAGAFQGSVSTLLEPFDVCIADAANPALKRASADLLRRAMVEAEGAERAIADRSAALDEAGFRGQVALLEGATDVFLHRDEGRDRLYRRDGTYRIRGSRWKAEEAEVLEQLEEDPTRFSPNVLLRPVVESYVFPTLSYVGGPSEIAYFAQVNALFDFYDIRPPVIVARFSGLVVEPKVERLLEQLGLGIEDLESRREDVLDRLARRAIPDGVREAFEKLRNGVAERFDDLIDQSAEIDATLKGSLGAARNRAMAEVVRAERKILRSIKRGDEIATDQLDRVFNALRPHGGPQERTLNVLPFLARYGGHFLREVEREVEASWRLPVAGD